MSDAPTSGTREPDDVLREVVAESVKANRGIDRSDLRVRYTEEPWLIDDLLRAGLLTDGQQMFPTIAGLERANTAEALEALEHIRWIDIRMRSDLPAFAQTNQSLGVLAEAVGLDEERIGYLLGVAAGSRPSPFKSWHIQNGRVSSFQWEGDPLIHARPIDSPVEISSATQLHFAARDFRGLREVQWSPEGVCVLAGPNGSGKSSLLEAVQLLRDAFERGVPQAVRLGRGAAGLRRLGAEGPPEIVLSIQRDDMRWTLRLAVEGGTVAEYPGEMLTAGDKVLLRRAAYSPDWYLGRLRRSVNREGQTCLRMAWDADPAQPELTRIVEALRSYRLYANYAITRLRDGGDGNPDDHVLDGTGQNLLLVLRNWQGAPRRFRDNFNRVLHYLRAAFPGVVEHIEFDPPISNIVPTRFFIPGVREALPIARAADGLLVGLLHLTAVAGAPDGGIVAIDEMENQLHPHAIRSLIGAMRELAEERRLTVILTTHSPVVMNEFHEHTDQFFVMEPGQATQPVALDKLKDPEWLSHFYLGNLYDRMEFGAPPKQGA